MSFSRKVVVAEDEETDVMLLQRALGAAGIEEPVEYARDGVEAINALNQCHAESVLLLLDLKMPRVDGFQVMEWLKRRGLARQVSIVILSSSGETEDITRAGALGARAYVVKPSDPCELVRVIERIRDLWQVSAPEDEPCAAAA